MLRKEALLEGEVLELVLGGRGVSLRLERLGKGQAHLLLVEVEPHREADAGSHRQRHRAPWDSALYGHPRDEDADERPGHRDADADAGTIWPSNWGRITTMTVSYGHGIAVTPLHLASAYAALVNGGMYRPATLRKLKPGEAPVGQRVFSAATSARMRQLLRLIVAAGTGRSADATGFRVGGKTGSAEKPEDGRYNKSSLVTTFAAAFPMDNPRYVVLTMMDGATSAIGLRTAAWTAAPVVKRVIERTGPMLGVMPDERRDVDISDLTPLLWKPKGEAE